MWARWDSTVRTLRKSEEAISLLVWPSGLSGELGAELRVEVGAALGGELDRAHQLGVGGVLEHVADGAGAQRRPGEGRVVLHGEHHNLGLRRAASELRDRLQARLAAHIEVKHQHPRSA